MPRKRTGTLVPKATSYFAKMWITRDGVSRREYINLGTLDPVLARRKMVKIARMVEEGQLVAEARVQAVAPDTVESAARTWVEAREARAVAMASTELGYFELHVFPHIGSMLVTNVRKMHIRRVLEAAAEVKGERTGKPLARETIAHLRRLLVRFFNSLEADEILATNPARLVPMPAVKADKRKRTLLADEEYSALLVSPVDFTPTKKTALPSVTELEHLEVKILAFTARTLGGARAAECLRWTWDMIDRPGFETCRLGRAKGGDYQVLTIPAMLRPFVAGWWLASGRPDSGVVFPVTRGKRKGEARGKSNLAGRLRRALLRAGVERHEVHNDTPHSKRVDFHCMRRGFVSGLATAGANEATSMALAHHHDSRVHQRYQLASIVDAPLAALPKLDLSVAPFIRPRRTPEKSPLETNARSVSGDSVMITERDTGFEPATSSLGSWHSTN
jgi:integrase